MTAVEVWEANNASFLASELAALRQRLTKLAPREPQGPPAEDAYGDARSGVSSFWRFVLGSSATATSPKTAAPRLALLPADGSRAHEADLAVAAARATDVNELPPALVLLARKLDLSKFEQDVLFLCAAMELDTRIAGLCARALGDVSRPYPTFSLALSLFDDPAWEALSPERPLRAWRLIEINQPGAQPLTASALRADERIVSFIKGLNHLDDRLSHLITPPRALPAVAPSQQAAVDAVLDLAAKSGERGESGSRVQLTGPDLSAKRAIASAASTALGLHLYTLAADLIPAHPGELDSLARLWHREALLLPVSLYVDAHDAEKGASDATLKQAVRFAERVGGLVFLDAPAVSSSATFRVLEIAPPTQAEQRRAWIQTLGEGRDRFAAALAGQFRLTLSDIRDAAASAQEAGRKPEDLENHLWRECLVRTRPRANSLTETIVPCATWNDIVLPPHEEAQLRQIAGQVSARTMVYDDWGFGAKMNRGLGIHALFAGESGTGKTMAAEVLANNLKLNLCRVDLSACVSKYIGETEKNLRRAFDATEPGGAILFFDEADALFGKRSEVKDAHDRYANIEINYLLQRMEAYRGLAILATNMKSALDGAFMRRLRFVVNFPFPGPAERKTMWEKAFPKSTPTRGLDFDRLAKLNLTGGNIHGIALNAAFLAATSDAPVTMPLIFEAARSELRKLERPVNEAELRWVERAGAGA